MDVKLCCYVLYRHC